MGDDVTKRKIAEEPNEPISTDKPSSSKFDSPNPFGSLADSIDMETTDDEMEDHVDSPPKLKTKTDKPVPITLKLTPNWKEIVEKIETIPAVKVKKRMFKDFINFYPSSVEGYRALQNYFSNCKFEYFGFPLKSKEPLKIVIKGIPRVSTISDIKSELTNLSVNGHTVAQLKSFKLKESQPICLVNLFRTEASKTIVTG